MVDLQCLALGIRRLQNLERLTRLEVASFAGNHISRIQHLDGCTALQDLQLQVGHAAMIWANLTASLLCEAGSCHGMPPQ